MARNRRLGSRERWEIVWKGWPGSTLLFSAFLLLLYPLQLSSQACIALSPDPNSGGVETGIGHQGDGRRVGLWANANIAGRIGVLAGASWGAIDSFAESGSELRGMIAIPLSARSGRVCIIGELERAHEPLRNTLGMTTGTLNEYWGHLGVAFVGDIGHLWALRFSWHLVPELILRRTHIWGRSTHREPELHVLEHMRVWGDAYFGGRAMMSAHHSRARLSLGFQNRPRIWSDMHWFVRLGFGI